MGGYCSDFGVEEPADLLVKNEGLQKRIWVYSFPLYWSLVVFI